MSRRVTSREEPGEEEALAKGAKNPEREAGTTDDKSCQQLGFPKGWSCI